MPVDERFEHSGSAGPTTLVAEVSPATTSLSIQDSTGYPSGSVGKFVVTLGRGTQNEERVLCLSRTGSTLTVSERGFDGTVARSHNAGVTVEHTWSSTEADNANRHTSSAAGVHGLAGEVVGTTDAQTLSNKTLVAPAVTDFTAAAHDHGDADDGGNIPQSSVTGLLAWQAGHEGGTSTHGVAEVAGVTEAQVLTNKTLVTPTIASFVNAPHDHNDAAGGGFVSLDRLSSVTVAARSVSSADPGPKNLTGLDIPTGVWFVWGSLRAYRSSTDTSVKAYFSWDITGAGASVLTSALQRQIASSDYTGGFEHHCIVINTDPADRTLNWQVGWQEFGGTFQTLNEGLVRAFRIG
jgi:hypothetical protein